MTNAKTIYLVDDDDDDRMLIREAIEGIVKNVTIVEITDGQELLELIEKVNLETDPSLILMDMNMPRMSGIESLSILKSNPSLRHIPIVMISTTSNNELIRQAYDQGINAYITKPVSIQEYNHLAEAINVCFLSNYPTLKSIPASINLTTQQILIIEDNHDHWELMKLTLNTSMPNIKLTRTEDRESTLLFLTDRLKNAQPLPELILLDLYMPNRSDGLQILAAIRNFFTMHRLMMIPIIVISSSDHIDDIKESYRNSANGYMVKSPDLEDSLFYFQELAHFWKSAITLPKKV
ncbi:response regulator [Dyadobacter subterraneus]|nr:response regulator [Dyadobacter subterraneus]